MNRLKSLVATSLLTIVFAVAAGGQQPTCNPGETNTPPCPSVPVTLDDGGALPVETLNPAVSSIDIVSLVETAFDMLLMA